VPADAALLRTIWVDLERRITPVTRRSLKFARRLDAGSLPLALLQLCCPASPLAVMAAVILVSGATRQGPSARVGSGS
jgi:hypothetical protein